jgi:hypothetical protein
MSSRAPDLDLTSNFDPNFMPQLHRSDFVALLSFPVTKCDNLDLKFGPSWG